MATQLFLLDSVADTHLGTDNTNLLGTAVGWTSKALGTARGSGVVASDNVATVTGATSGITITKTSPVEWISPPVAADVTISGTITLNIWSSETNMSANVAINARIFVIRANATATRNSNTLDTIATTARVIEVAVTTRLADNFTVTPTSTTLNRGDRIRVVVFGDDVGTMAATYTFNISWGGTSAAVDGDSYVTFTENITFESAPGNVRINNDVTLSGNVLISGGTLGTDQKWGQSFVGSGTVTGVRLPLLKTGTPVDNLVVEIQSESGGLPSGTVIGTVATISGATVPTTSTWVTLPCSIALGGSGAYWLVLSRDGARDTTNYYRSGYTNSDTYAGGVRASIQSGAGWSLTGSGDLVFVLDYTDPSLTSVVYLTDTASAASTGPALLSSFTGADENPLSESGNWAALNTSGFPLRRISSAVSATTAGANASYWTPANVGPDLEAIVTISNVTGVVGILVRIQGEGGAATWDGYSVEVSGGSFTDIKRYDNGTATAIRNISAGSWSAGEKLGVRCEGSLIELWRYRSGAWKHVGSAIDTTYASAGKVGLLMSSTTGRLDDFYASTDTHLLVREGWTSRGSGVLSYLTDTLAGWTAPLLAGEWFTRPLTAFTLTGMAVANLRALESNAAANASLRCQVARVEGDGTSPTVWADWAIAPTSTDNGELTTSEVARTANVSGDDLAITDGQRLRIRVYADDMSSAAMATANTVTLYYAGTSGGASGDTYITFPQTLTEFASGTPGPSQTYRQRRASRFLTSR